MGDITIAWKKQGVLLSVEFTVLGVYTDPTTVTLTIKDPTGTKTDYTYAGGQITKTATGKYEKLISTPNSGDYYWGWVGTGSCESSCEGYFRIKTNL